MRATFMATLLSVAAIGFFFAIIGVFGILPAIAALMLYVAIACVLNVRRQSLWVDP